MVYVGFARGSRFGFDLFMFVFCLGLVGFLGCLLICVFVSGVLVSVAAGC